MSDLKYVLRTQTFPQCAEEALKITEQLIASQTAGRSVIARSQELCREIIAEFVFCEIPGRNSMSTLNSMQNLKLIELLCNYFACGNISTELFRVHQFLILFPCGQNSRSKLLTKLVSVAIASRCRSALLAAGIWLQQSGVTSLGSLTLAQGLVDDYFILVPEAAKTLHYLPSLAPQFTANFLAAVAHLYSPAGGLDRAPPSPLLSIITSWISSMPGLCKASITAQPFALPHAIVMPPITPFAGLFRWCILAPFRGEENLSTYSQLHLALMESVLDGNLGTGLVAAPHLAVIVPQLLNLARGASSSHVNKAIDRILQAVLVFLHNRCIFGNTQELFGQLSLLPDNPLLTIVTTKFLGV